MSSSQATRFLAIETVLGADILLLKSFTFREQLGCPFELEADLMSEGADLDFDQVIGTNATVRLTMPNGTARFFNGYVSRFLEVGIERGFALYKAVIVPWLWFLTQTTDCRIFQKKKVPDIIEDVFKSHGFKDYKLQLTAHYREREYCVQYRESDFSFVSRLMEQEGIYYFFSHENGIHTLQLADSASAHACAEGYETLAFKPRNQSQEEWSETVTDWKVEKDVRSGAFSLSDFNFKAPAAPITVSANIHRAHEAAGFEVYDYPGEYALRSEGEAYAKLRIEEIQSQHEIVRAETTARGVASGRKFKLSKHYRTNQNREYLITQVALEASAGAYGSSTEEHGDFYTGRFTAIPANAPFRSPRVTPKPIIPGPQTAIVVGKAGEEIDTDEFGRVKVQFHWDRYGKVDENSSCWVRVSQAWAGKGWGAIYIPRIGQEVIVEFLEGNPDQPIITGRVYNAVAKVPHPLPQHKTISTIKSSSSKGGEGFNEIRFEDQKGEEQIYIHGEKNLDIRIKNDAYETIEHDRHLVVTNNQFERVENDRHEQIKRDHVETIGRDHSAIVKGKESIEVRGSHSFKVKDNVAEVFQKNQSTLVSHNLYIKAENIVLEAFRNITINVGDSYLAIDHTGIKIATNGEIVLEAKRSITQQAGTEVKIHATAGAEMNSPMTTIKGDGILTLNGGLVKIN